MTRSNPELWSPGCQEWHDVADFMHHKHNQWYHQGCDYSGYLTIRS